MVPHVLRDWGYTDERWLTDAALIVDELVSNAVKHADGCTGLSVHADADGVRVAAADTSPQWPRRRKPDFTGGRGLMIIEELAARWGVEPNDDGKSVWADLPPYPDPR